MNAIFMQDHTFDRGTFDALVEVGGVSVLEELTREELIALVLSLHKTVQRQQREITEFRETVEQQTFRIKELEGVEVYSVASVNSAVRRG